jgi:hypothetical protein
MLNAQSAFCAPLFILALLGATACTREAPGGATAPAVTPPADARFGWAREALERNPRIEVLAADPQGIFTVRLRESGALRTFRLDELVGGPPDGVAAEGAVSLPAPTESAPIDAGSSEAASAEPPDATARELTVTRDAGRVSITGPGVSIATAGAVAAGPDEPAPGGAETPRASAEHRGGQPIVCQGERQMRIDGRSIEFDADGLIVEEGCDLYLTNSRINAGRTAIRVTRGKVHIVNSAVSGGHSSIDASLGAQVFLSGATIDGLQRRFDTAQINDLGGNRYQ